MTAQAITVAITDGVPADEIGREAAKRLGFRYVNDEVITTAAQVAGVTPEDIADVEHSRPLVERIIMALARTATPSLEEVGVTSDFLPASATDESPIYRDVIRQVLWKTGEAGKVVIGAHGASIHLATMPNVLRVLVTGSPEVRATRLADSASLPEREARRRVDHGDRERAAYLKRFYGVGRELPTHYDLVVNMDVLPVDAAVNVITAAAQSMS